MHFSLMFMVDLTYIQFFMFVAEAQVISFYVKGKKNKDQTRKYKYMYFNVT